ncbi:hypothetical protein EXU30_11600 [Shewanella maritima]|uniref:Uncharacterized protein n=1 Tax=Shewanella maritima TaxID=2520507 RepID=A0A411PI33_9GAMM|nr:hypothetical protein [Shewanella maritima]QBF83271.1 hypothetical protein EXU30_11600 [Shewanella maritima]
MQYANTLYSIPLKTMVCLLATITLSACASQNQAENTKAVKTVKTVKVVKAAPAQTKVVTAKVVTVKPVKKKPVNNKVAKTVTLVPKKYTVVELAEQHNRKDIIIVNRVISPAKHNRRSCWQHGNHFHCSA